MSTQKKILIIENDSQISDRLNGFIEKNDFNTTILNEFDKKGYPLGFIIQKMEEHDHIAIESTFSNIEQFESIIDNLTNFTDKTYYLMTIGHRLHHKINEVRKRCDRKTEDNLFDLFQENEIKELISEEYIDHEKSGNFFKAFNYYFDEIPFYYNAEHDAYFPERPKCFYDNPLKPIFKYKPKWELRSWVFDSDQKF